jgi:gliding motility-associated-like protein
VGATPRFSILAQNGFPPYTYELWENGVFIQSNQTGEFAYGSAGNSYTIRLIDSCGTSAQIEPLLIHLDAPAQAITVTDTTCVGGIIELACMGLGASAFHWDGPAGSGFSSNSQFVTIPNVTAAYNGSYTLTFQPPGCGSPITQTGEATVYIPPPPPYPDTVHFCQNGDNTLPPATTLAQHSFVWYGADSVECLPPVMDVSYYHEAVYYVAQRSDVWGCVSDKRKTLFTVDTLTLLPESLPIYQFNQPYSLQFTSNAVGATYTYTGTLPAGLSLSAGGLLSGVPTYNPNATNATITVTVTDEKGCSTAKVYLLNTCALKPAVADNNAAYCAGDVATPLQATAEQGYVLYWYDGNMNRLTGAPTPGTGIAGQQTYYVAQFNVAELCEGALDTVRVTVHPLPNLTFEASAADVCYLSSPAILLANMRENYTYDIFADPSLSLKVASITATSEQGSRLVALTDVLESDARYYITVTSNFGCVSAQAEEVAVTVIRIDILPERLPPYRKNERYDVGLLTNAAFPVFTMTGGALPAGLSLSPAGQISGVVPIHEPCRIARFTVQVEDANACTATRNYTLPCDYFAPRVFTPNGDGINDIFMRGYKVVIFDRLGVVIYEGEDGWDGTYKNKPAPSDIYFYKIYVETETGEPEIKTGYIGVERER